ncbi:uncharacterized protein Z519_06822 [Cladophialophora bantiana CBS 173.52]|uniref:DNA-directed RNA polymerase III subunit RPC3 n=1 Tax=Cladophialophora bantiana (strain ATCC 10958 / CBS 173.52 / CDC B-1940 / NIH 8579) TaxID=1442370 RepID=A0A0D2HIA9_CLAB1|nr:uncharacterized protein Z519_06822 [Cladophialophora bantiana CBS 173.52]KIW92973.1 hypothetical protein Z519_06822 [Cladophialophora bantiana CBS 173.52]
MQQIFRQLAQFGRLSINQIAQKCRLPLRQVKTGVASLIQLRLVYHHTSLDGLSTYQANTGNAYNIMRTGRLLELVESKFGSAGANIMEYLAVVGFAAACELEARVLGDGDPSKSMDRTHFRALLKQLITSKFILTVREAHFHSPFDSRQDAERYLSGHGMLLQGTGKKIKIDGEARVDVELEQRLDGSISWPQVLHELETSPSKANILLSVDYSNLILYIRNERVTEAAEKIFGRRTAEVARAACLQLEDIDPRPLKLRLPDNPGGSLKRLDISQISRIVSSEGRPAMGNGQSRENGWLAADQLSNGHHDHGVNGTSGDHQFIERQLGVLAEGPFIFLLEDPATKSWAVDKGKLNDFLWEKEMLRLIDENMSGPALRIVRMLADKGKLDERTMQDVGLLNAKELRMSLAKLQMNGFLELQEVPRDPQRQPKSTTYLYFYDPERVRKVFLDKLYKTMSRLYERLHLERDKLSSTLSKVERSDVQGSEEEILSPGELQVLLRWRQKESWFMTEIHRIDASVAILRDI